uniref:Tubulin-specific chaperone D n=1 Tax=Sinocyclocheilus rhinocerous TaxID=307959 RepID=A0A673FQE7_9TELE
MSVMEGVCNGEEPELVAQACVLSELSESDETRAFISSLPDIHHDTVSREATIEKFLVIMDPYQEQPHLLDPLRFLYIISKARWCYKIFMQLFPHKVSEVQPIYSLTSRGHCLNTYRLSLCLKDLYFLHRFVTRPDVKQKCLGDFLDWCLTTVSQTSKMTMEGNVTLDGALQSLAQLFKHGKRDDFLQYAPTVLQCLNQKRIAEINQATLCKLGVKVVQRICLSFLKPRLAKWRYQRGSRSLTVNLAQSSVTGSVEATKPDLESVSQEKDYDMPQEVKKITIVRWSSAKGIGRVTGRLPKELADDVVESVLECFSFLETDNAWHGGCLALAELGRRGLLLPSRLSDVVPVILKALTYDEKRDAACYVCWAFARAYDPSELKPYVNQISRALVIATVFDRNVTCRKVASVIILSPQGTFPHGIDILTAVDYFTVGNLNNYLTISVYIAGFEEYTKPLIGHLAAMKGDLATKALHNLTVRAPEYMANTVLPQLLPMATGMDLLFIYTALSNRSRGLCRTLIILRSGASSRTHLMAEGGETRVRVIKNAPTTLKADIWAHSGFYEQPVCGLIEKLSLSKMPFEDDPVISESTKPLYIFAVSVMHHCRPLTDISLVLCRVQHMMCCLAQQAAEKIDCNGAHAGTGFLCLLHSTDPAVPHIPHREELLSIFPPETGNSLNWNAASQAFPHITQLLRLHQYQYHTLLGLTVSVSGLTESTVRYSSQSLFEYLKSIQQDVTALQQFGDTLLRIFRDDLRNDRISVPLLKMVVQLLANSCFDLFAGEESHPFCGELLSLCKEEIKKSKDVQKLLSIKRAWKRYCARSACSSIARTKVSARAVACILSYQSAINYVHAMPWSVKS